MSDRSAIISIGLAWSATAFKEICCRLQTRHNSVMTPIARGSRAPGEASRVKVGLPLTAAVE